MVKDHFRVRGKEMPVLSYSQALLPKGATAIRNLEGAAPGVACEVEGRWLIALPGVPSEMKCTLEAALPLFAETGVDRLRTRTIHTTGLTESEIRERLGGSLVDAAVHIAFLPTVGGVDIILKERGAEEQSTRDVMENSEAVLQSRIGAYIYGRDGESLERAVGRVLESKRMSLSVAESCTGGLIEHRITGVEGSSDYFLGGVVAYSSEVKETLLGVPHELLIEYGAVSNEVARRMAAGVRRLLRSDIGISVTGIAGPRGAVPGKPVGLVYIGLAADGAIECEERRFFGNRAEIKEQSAQATLDLLRRYLGGL
jgi:nicotinamide-nucleotide amidase